MKCVSHRLSSQQCCSCTWWPMIYSPLCLGTLCLSGVAPTPEAAVRLFQQQEGWGKRWVWACPPYTCYTADLYLCISMVHIKCKSFELIFFCSYTILLSFSFYKADRRMQKKFKCCFASVFASTLTSRRNNGRKKSIYYLIIEVSCGNHSIHSSILRLQGESSLSDVEKHWGVSYCNGKNCSVANGELLMNNKSRFIPWLVLFMGISFIKTGF